MSKSRPHVHKATPTYQPRQICQYITNEIELYYLEIRSKFNCDILSGLHSLMYSCCCQIL